MKKKISIILIGAMCLMGFSGCYEKKESTSEASRVTEVVESTETATETEIATEIETATETEIAEEAEIKAAEYNANIPEEYKDLFINGAFDENMVWHSNDSRYKELIEKIEPLCEEKMYGSIIIASDDEVIFSGGWNALEIDEKTTVNPYTTYEVGSITKQITAAAILQLVDEGKLDVSETIDKYFPEYPHGAKITIEHLLHMESGIPDYANERSAFWGSAMDQGKDVFEVYDTFRYAGTMSQEEVLEYFYKTDLNFEPGSAYAYSNTNYLLLAIILEQVTGHSYDEYIKENIFDICGMKNSTCNEVGNITSVPMPDGVEGYENALCKGTGDIHSNVCDYLLWSRALMNKQILNETQLTYMTTMSKGYACGWYEENGNLHHDGSTLCYVSLTFVYPTDEKNYYFIYMSPYRMINHMIAMNIDESIKEYIRK